MSLGATGVSVTPVKQQEEDALADSKRVLGTWQERGASMGFWENREEAK